MLERTFSRRSGLVPCAALSIALASVLGACQAPPTVTVPTRQASVHGPVSDLDAFSTFIAGRPTPAAFRARYPDVRLVLPGDMATKEYRMDHSRYFAELDDQGRIVGGGFR